MLNENLSVYIILIKIQEEFNAISPKNTIQTVLEWTIGASHGL